MFFLEVDPSVVKPGWTPLIITILLAAAIVLLMISMRRQIRKIRAPHRDEIEDSAPGQPMDGPTASASGDSAGTSTDDATGGSTGGANGTNGSDRHPVSHS
jgi:hypothetical protein